MIQPERLAERLPKFKCPESYETSCINLIRLDAVTTEIVDSFEPSVQQSQLSE